MMKDVIEVVICGNNILIIYTPDMEDKARWFYGMWLFKKRYNVKMIKLPEEYSGELSGKLEDVLKEVIKSNCF